MKTRTKLRIITAAAAVFLVLALPFLWVRFMYVLIALGVFQSHPSETGAVTLNNARVGSVTFYQATNDAYDMNRVPHPNEKLEVVFPTNSASSIEEQYAVMANYDSSRTPDMKLAKDTNALQATH